MVSHIEQNKFSEKFINLANPRLGAEVVFVSDDFFAECSRMLNPDPAVFIPGKFDDNGKWMDGWESRRKRVEGYDYCIVRLGRPGAIRGLEIDTSHFIGNHPPAASLEACNCHDGDPTDATQWTEVLPSVSLQQDNVHLFDVEDKGTYSHIRLNMYPDGGIARLRVYGEPKCDWDEMSSTEVIDLLALEYGGLPIACSDQCFGSSMLSLNMPGRGINMGDGWETKRRREPGNEWVILKLGHPGELTSVELDTAHYKGNYPDRASMQASYVKGGTKDSIITQSMFWQTILPEQKLQMDHVHSFSDELTGIGPITHVRVNNIPDGGISRVRLFGKISRSGS